MCRLYTTFIYISDDAVERRKLRFNKVLKFLLCYNSFRQQSHLCVIFTYWIVFIISYWGVTTISWNVNANSWLKCLIIKERNWRWKRSSNMKQQQIRFVLKHKTIHSAIQNYIRQQVELNIETKTRVWSIFEDRMRSSL